MLIIPPPARKRTSRTTKRAPAPVVGPVLTNASFDSRELAMDFDRDVSVAGIVLTSIVVNDPASGSTYRATGASVVADITVVVTMESPYPDEAAEFVNCVVNAYVAEQ